MIKLTQNESTFCQALAMTSLLSELSGHNFLESDYYQNLCFSGNNDFIKKILKDSGLGNPATMQMFLYALLVMPKEILDKLDKAYLDKCANQIDHLVSSKATKITTTYNNEQSTNLTSIKFYAHIRNAVSHSKCSYDVVNGECYVTFKDQLPRDPQQYCEFTLKTADVGSILETLQKQLMDFLNTQWKIK